MTLFEHTEVEDWQRKKEHIDILSKSMPSMTYHFALRYTDDKTPVWTGYRHGENI